MEFDLRDVTLGLAEDLQKLRSGKITNADARARAALARELLRSIHLQLEGMKVIEATNSKLLPNLPKKRKSRAA